MGLLLGDLVRRCITGEIQTERKAKHDGDLSLQLASVFEMVSSLISMGCAAAVPQHSSTNGNDLRGCFLPNLNHTLASQ